MLRTVPLKRTGAIKAKRAVPRNGRVQHARIKPNGRFPDKHVKAYWQSLERRCVLCGTTENTVIHHILQRLPQKVRQRDHRFVAVLCASHHSTGDGSVHALGSEALFKRRYGLDLVAIAVRNWEAFDGHHLA